MDRLARRSSVFESVSAGLYLSQTGVSARMFCRRQQSLHRTEVALSPARFLQDSLQSVLWITIVGVISSLAAAETVRTDTAHVKFHQIPFLQVRDKLCFFTGKIGTESCEC